MITQDTLTDCRWCSQVSKANGEDPIGTARTASHWLVIEWALPWTEAMFHDDPRIASFLKLFKQLFMQHGVMLSPTLIVPDPDYSQPDQTRVIYYHRPQPQFARFEKQEFIVPEERSADLITALIKRLMKKPNQLDQFQTYQRDTSHIREILVCTHGNVDAACARFGFPIYKQLKEDYAAHSDGQLRVWRCSHFGGHKFAPTLIDLPQGQYWGHLESDSLDLLVHRQGDVAGLRPFYRGWSGLSKFEQMAEREAWMQEGWDWLAYQKSGRALRKGLTGIKRYLYPLLRWIPLKRVQFFLEQWTQDATWADVQIQFVSADRATSGHYRARVEKNGVVTTAAQSPKAGEAIALKTVPQYQVEQLVREAM